METGEFIRSVIIHGKQWCFLKSFFSPNISARGGARCKGCDKRHLSKYDRVDVEFFGNDLVSYCLKCWPDAILERKKTEAARVTSA